MLSFERKRIQIELWLLLKMSNNFRDRVKMRSSFFPFLIAWFLSHLLWAVWYSSSRPGVSSSEAIRNTFTCPLFIWTASRTSGRRPSVLFFAYVHFIFLFFPSGTSCCCSLFIFSWGRISTSLPKIKKRGENEWNLVALDSSCCQLVYVFVALSLITHLSLLLQWLDANPSFTFSSFSTSYSPRLWNLE